MCRRLRIPLQRARGSRRGRCGDVIGVPMIATRPEPAGPVRLRGEAALRCFSDDATFSVPDPASFRVELTALHAPGIALQVFSATEHEGLRGPAEIAPGPGRVVTTLVVSGRLRVWDRGVAADLAPGTLSLLDTTGPHHWQFLLPMTVIYASVAASSLPDPLLPSRLPCGVLQRTRLVSSYISIMQNLAESSSSFTAIEADYLWRAFANLEVAVIAEAAGEVGPEPDAVRTRITDYVHGHLGDPTLGPESLALALGISVRSGHRSFDGADLSVHRYIREQRLRQVEAALRDEQRFLRTGALSKRFGFTGPDQLSRAFRARFGMTIQAYRETLHSGIPD